MKPQLNFCVLLIRINSYTIESNDGTPPVVVFLDGTAYQHVHDGVDTVITFNRLTLLPEESEAEPRGFKRKAASSALLAKSTVPEEMPPSFSGVLLPHLRHSYWQLFAIYLAKTSPRQGRYGKLVLGVLLFFVVHGASLVLKSSMEQGKVHAFPGMWMVVIGLSITAAYMMKKEY